MEKKNIIKLVVSGVVAVAGIGVSVYFGKKWIDKKNAGKLVEDVAEATEELVEEA